MAILTSALGGPICNGASRCYAAQEDGAPETTASFQKPAKTVFEDSQTKTIRIATWYNEYDLGHLKAYLASTFPDYVFEYEYIDKSNYEPIMDDKLSFKGAPDILFVDQEMARKHAITGYIADITDVCQDFVPKAKVQFGYGNSVYAVPNTSQFICIYYNKEMFEEYGVRLPTDLDSFISVCDYLRLVKGMKPLSISFKNPYDVCDLFLAYMAADYFNTDRGAGFGGRLQYGRTTFTEELTPFIDDWEKLISHKIIDRKMYTLDKKNSIEEFAAGECAMICGGPDTYNAIIRLNPDIKVGTMPFYGSSGKKRAIIGGCDCGFAVNKFSMNFTEAKEVVASLGTFKGQLALWRDRPGSQTYLKDTTFVNDDAFDGIKGVLYENLTYIPWMEWGDELNREPRRRLGLELQKAILGNQSYEEVLENVDNVVSQILEDG